MRRYYVADHLGSVRAVVDTTGSVVEARDYAPWGLVMPGRVYVQGSKTREGFTGHELDRETGLVYAGARYYMPALGRWTAVDPLADFFPGWSGYNYAYSSPTMWIDPTGLTPECAGRQTDGYCGFWRETDSAVVTALRPGSIREPDPSYHGFGLHRDNYYSYLSATGIGLRGGGATVGAAGAGFRSASNFAANQAASHGQRLDACNAWVANGRCSRLARRVASKPYRMWLSNARSGASQRAAAYGAQATQLKRIGTNMLRRAGIGVGALATGIAAHQAYASGDTGEAVVTLMEGTAGIVAGVAVGMGGAALISLTAAPLAIALSPAILVGAAAVAAGYGFGALARLAGDAWVRPRFYP